MGCAFTNQNIVVKFECFIPKSLSGLPKLNLKSKINPTEAYCKQRVKFHVQYIRQRILSLETHRNQDTEHLNGILIEFFPLMNA